MLREDEIDLLLNDLLKLYGYDFYDYSRESLKRRVSKILRLEKFSSFEEFRNRIINDPGYIEHLVDRLTVNVTQMFRDCDFFMELRNDILPQLKSLSQIRIWHAGCSTGEEVFSLAILLHESGLLDRAQVHATDINPLVIEKAKKGAFPLSLLKVYERNYLNSGGNADFSTYYTASDNNAVFKSYLSDKVVFNTHNLASGQVINQFDLILCRNVVIYFDNELRERVFQLFDASLLPGSFLALGEKETLKSFSITPRYQQTGKEKIWKKLSQGTM